ncbi:cell envelope integrity protein CreD [Chitinophaga pinensis]|uniref:Inner membrane CreD family protein n=1 Tax=Chitinophaga pinensis (strain ATCC 43595 / DSM 2588 / LMG 13176 / NBRC 15968 / NCIMB 11800 / UQM 2034) TaxID=485918 RepID=A0A979GQ37_CHIPD|nr:cell envelope integrity protein CreD [Chitinophaga pinensis]ACU57919.1 Inner membrane CreD family protein [Chitinophaga pinensis DSM 2588]
METTNINDGSSRPNASSRQLPDTTEPRPSFFERYAYGVKALLIGILVLLLLIPANMIMGLISEREHRQFEAKGEVSGKWGDAQTITGPVLVIPYYSKPNVVSNAIFLPEKLKVNGQLMPEIRRRGIYEVAVYTSRLDISGAFSKLDLSELNIPAEAVLLKDAYLAVGVNDMRGISNQAGVQWNSQTFYFNPGIPAADLFSNGMQVKVPLSMSDSGIVAGNFAVNLELKGSGQLYFSPVGKTTSVEMKSNWTNPSFDGAFLPNAHHVDDKGFTAAWQVSNLNRNFPQSWIGNNSNLHSADFGVKLFLPVDTYQQSTRAVKYAILIIGLSFLVYYFIELLQRYSVHPLQYILIGVALCVFYTLLIALAEQLNFSIAYLISAVMTIGLVSFYTASVLRSVRLAAGIGGALSLLYGFIYVIIRSEDQALLMGSLGLFIILAIVMYFSRRIKWGEL